MNIAELIAEIKKESVATALGENYATIVQSLNEIDRDFEVAEKAVGKAESEAMKRKERIRELEAEKASSEEAKSTLEQTISQLTSDKEATQKSLEDYQTKINSYNEKNKKEWTNIAEDFKIRENEKLSRYYDFENDTPEAIEKNLEEFKKQKDLGVLKVEPPLNDKPREQPKQNENPSSLSDVFKEQVKRHNK
ncbi:MAG: hypothetical protein ACRBG0_27780 [Lewinella sp.]|uniref:hypothetical protein n=1 Tax=Lewinella sp. TaxID=2004506 RepID=UPI003D6BB4CC